MKKYARIYWILLKINFANLFAYRANFYNSIIITIGWGVISILSMILMTFKTSSVYGWQREELFLLGGIYSMAIGIFHMLFSSGFEKFSRIISLGELDSYLIKPIDTPFFLSARVFRPISFLRILIGFFFTLYVLSILHVTLTIVSFLFFVIFIFCGVCILYSLWFLVITITVWKPNLSNLIDFLYQISNLGRYPPSMLIYTKNIVVFILIPLTLVSSVPARFVLGRISPAEIGAMIACALGLFIASRLFWKFALKHYSSASS